MHSENSTRTFRQAARGRSGKLLILRFTARGLRRPRLDTTRSCKISASTVSWNAFLARGGKSAVGGQLATNHPHGKEEREALNVRLRETLARKESLRKKDFDVMMNAILLSQRDREREVRKLLDGYLAEQRDMARQLRENLGTFRDDLENCNIGRISEFHEAIGGLLKKQEERKAEVAARLRMLQNEQSDLSRSLAELLSKGRELKIRDLKTMLRRFEARSGERALQCRERREIVQKMFGVFRKKSADRHTDTRHE